MAHVPGKLQKIAETAAPLDIELRFKPMFGGIGAYAHGRMFLSLSDVGLALKLGESERQELLRVKGAKPLQYEPDSPPSKSYVVLPDTMLSDAKTLQAWLARSAAFVRTQEPKRKKK
jgi:TfoX/Sxy family transcriptional regulator of competence genes